MPARWARIVRTTAGSGGVAMTRRPLAIDPDQAVDTSYDLGRAAMRAGQHVEVGVSPHNRQRRHQQGGSGSLRPGKYCLVCST